METLPIPRTTLTEMCAAWTASTEQIKQAFSMISEAEARLHTAFQEQARFSIQAGRGSCIDFKEPEAVISELQRSAWRALINKMGIRSAMSIKRAADLDAQLEGKGSYGQKVEPLPEITEANILAMMENTFNTIDQMLEEAVKEIFDWLRPTSHFGLEYKTNQKSQWELKDKLILSWCVQNGYSHEKPFRVNYHRQQNITAPDNVFAMLDGKGLVKTNYGPLTDAISASTDGTGQTDYFEFRCFRNNNLHLKFRRMDLVSKLNRVAGGMRLKDAPKAQAA